MRNPFSTLEGSLPEKSHNAPQKLGNIGAHYFTLPEITSHFWSVKQTTRANSINIITHDRRFKKANRFFFNIIHIFQQTHIARQVMNTFI